MTQREGGRWSEGQALAFLKALTWGSPASGHLISSVTTVATTASKGPSMMNTDPRKSSQPCGCDEGANWICERHTAEALAAGITLSNTQMTNAQTHSNLNAIDFSILNQIGNSGMDTAMDKGFNVSEIGPEIDRKLLLIVGEVVEAHEELRSGHAPTEIYYVNGSDKPEGVPVELADALIRILQFARSQKINIGDAVELKMRYNRTRPPKHGREF